MRQANIQFHGEDKLQALERLNRSIEDSAVIFRRIVSGTKTLETANGNCHLYEYLEKKLSSQLMQKADTSRDSASFLQDASAGRVDQTYRNLSITIGFFTIMLVFNTILASSQLGELIRKRLTPLHDGAKTVADGDLDYRIQCDGADEFAELALSINAMTDKLELEILAHKQMEQALEEALDRLQKIASRVPGVVYQYRLRLDGSSCFPFASEAIRDIFRVSPEEVREDASIVFAILHPDDYDNIIDSIQKSARDLTPWCHEFRVKFDDGMVRWLLGNSLPQLETDGSILWHGFITDITDRHQMEKKLRDSDALNVSILNSLTSHIAVLDSEGVIVTINRAWRQFAKNHGLSKSSHSMLGANYLDICKKSFKQSLGDGTNSAYAGIVSVLSGKKDSFHMEYLFPLPNQQYWFHMNVAPLRGSRRGVVVSHENITERKQAQKTIASLNEKLEKKIHKQNKALTRTNLSLMKKIEELRRSKQQLLEREAKLNSIFNASVEGIITIDMSDIVVSVNAAVETIFGYKPKELIGYNISKLMRSSPREMHYYNTPLTAQPVGQIKEAEGIHKNGRPVPLDMSITEYFIGKISYFTCIVRDVSLRKHREQQDKEHLAELAHVTRLGLMGEMASGIAHEINQPLAAVSTYTQVSLNLINTENLDLAMLTEILYKTQQQALRAGQIIHRMREFIKSHAPHRSTININTLIHNAVSLCIADLKQDNIMLIFELENNLPPICVDQVQIEQVIINLIRNSIDALKDLSEAPERQITIHSRLTADNGVQVRVKDNGMGINENQQQKILMPFYTTKSNGMGMGLSISRSLIEAHEGTFYFNSESKKGTTFYFNLPIQKEFDKRLKN
ncbi:PAS domain S-box protein [Methylobacter sp.]|uniref:PAS domain S-box protein n=1 Tax=Methylobacter sp. TaxID=2051955 RepID=UPI0025CF1FCB|nr:PAS domain S-box protein [Methylobacter sp.]